MAISNEALMDGVKPVEVMLSNMRYYYGRAESALSKILKKLEKTEMTAEEVKEVVKDMMTMHDYREKSTYHASQVARFVHPTLTAIAVNVTNEHRITLPSDMSVDDALARYEDNLKRFPRTINGDATPVIPLKPTKDSDDGGGMAS